MCLRIMLTSYAVAAIAAYSLSDDLGWLATAVIAWVGGAVLCLLLAGAWFLMQEKSRGRTTLHAISPERRSAGAARNKRERRAHQPN